MQRANAKGLIVVLAGPDGTGKSTLARRLPEACANSFSGYTHRHWRPGLLPWPSKVLGTGVGDPTKPHDRAPHSTLVSTARVLYDWTDFLLGTLVQLHPARRRGHLVVLERGWWDLAVDQKRYRLDVPPQLIRILGRLLPRPDLVLVLQAPAHVLLARKQELSVEELTRQLNAWQNALPRRIARSYVDVSPPFEEVVDDARRQILVAANRQNYAPTGQGWAGLPRRKSPRWLLPRGPRRVARSALLIYQPVTFKGRAAWEIARRLAGAGAFKLLPKGETPPDAVREAVRPYLSSEGTVAVTKSKYVSGKFVALALDEDGTCRAVAKIGLQGRARDRINKERHAIERLGHLLPPPVAAPRVLGQDDGVLILDVVTPRPRLQSWRLPEEVAYALGVFFRAGCDASGNAGPAQGDCAPWNLMKTDDGWVLVDWELARYDVTPFFDLFHYLTESHAMLGRPSISAIEKGLRGQGWVARVVDAYAAGAGADARDARPMFSSYLQSEQSQWLDTDPRTAQARRGLIEMVRR
jgi:thymidylate kinase